MFAKLELLKVTATKRCDYHTPSVGENSPFTGLRGLAQRLGEQGKSVIEMVYTVPYLLELHQGREDTCLSSLVAGPGLPDSPLALLSHSLLPPAQTLATLWTHYQTPRGGGLA